MKILILAFWLAELLFLGIYIRTCWPVRTRTSFYVKLICASIFLAYGITLAALIRSGANISFTDPNSSELSAAAHTFVQFPNGAPTARVVHLILWALLYGWIGDFFLGLAHQIGDDKESPEEKNVDYKDQLKNKKTAVNALGVLAFILGHILYCVAFGRGIAGYEFGLHWWSALLFLLPFLCYLAVGLGLKLGKHLAPLGFYFLAVGAMFGTALTLGIELWSVNRLFSGCLMTGAIFFFLSDLLLSLESYGGEKFKKFGLRVTRQIAYFTGQMFLASNILFFYSV